MSKLTAAVIRQLKKGPKTTRHWDGEGVYLEMRTSGRKVFMWKYRVAGADGKRREKRLTLGEWSPSSKTGYLTLSEARQKAAEARQEVMEGRGPAITRKVSRAARAADEGMTFSMLADQWREYAAGRRSWGDRREAAVASMLRKHINPQIGDIPAADIRAAMTFPLVTAVTKTSPSMAGKVEWILHQVLDHGVRTGALELNPLPASEPHPTGASHPALTTLADLHGLMAKAAAANPTESVRRAHLILALTATRIANITEARWDHIDLDRGLRVIPRDEMKMQGRPDHQVPLPAGLVAEMRTWSRDDDRVAPVAGATVGRFYRNLGYRDTHRPQSWRASFSTLMNEAGYPRAAIEAQLDHVVRGVEGIYNRAQLLDLRREVMQEWENSIRGVETINCTGV